MYTLYSAGLWLVFLAYLPVFAWKKLARSGYRQGLAQRWGHFEPGLPAEPRCWIHAVSVGEAAAAAPLVEAIGRRWPDLAIVVTTVTPTGARIVAGRLGDRAIHRYFPVDLPGPVRRSLDAVRPRFFIGLETELWPNFFRALGRRGVPAMVANGRVSDRSFRRYQRIRWFVARMLRDVSVFAMQSQEDARRIVALGAPAERVVVTGNLKADLGSAPADLDPAWRDRLGLAPGAALWIAGSTHPGEEAIVLDAHAALAARVPGLRLLLAPRHPERAAEVERLVEARGFRAARRTALEKGGGAGAVIVLDTVGELAQLYELADVVFVGGSLVPIGGHNMLEPAQRRKPVLFGPDTSNFREAADRLLAAGGAVVVKDEEELAREVLRLCERAERRREMGEAAFGAAAGQEGALRETMALIDRHLVGGRGREGQ
jgi:3-deoxy-D-manno-octulosonic-acid transferase